MRVFLCFAACEGEFTKAVTACFTRFLEFLPDFSSGLAGLAVRFCALFWNSGENQEKAFVGAVKKKLKKFFYALEEVKL
jgi:hypothetical protein